MNGVWQHYSFDSLTQDSIIHLNSNDFKKLINCQSIALARRIPSLYPDGSIETYQESIFLITDPNILSIRLYNNKTCINEIQSINNQIDIPTNIKFNGIGVMYKIETDNMSRYQWTDHAFKTNEIIIIKDLVTALEPLGCQEIQYASNGFLDQIISTTQGLRIEPHHTLEVKVREGFIAHVKGTNIDKYIKANESYFYTNSQNVATYIQEINFGMPYDDLFRYNDKSYSRVSHLYPCVTNRKPSKIDFNNKSVGKDIKFHIPNYYTNLKNLTGINNILYQVSKEGYKNQNNSFKKLFGCFAHSQLIYDNIYDEIDKIITLKIQKEGIDRILNITYRNIKNNLITENFYLNKKDNIKIIAIAPIGYTITNPIFFNSTIKAIQDPNAEVGKDMQPGFNVNFNTNNINEVSLGDCIVDQKGTIKKSQDPLSVKLIMGGKTLSLQDNQSYIISPYSINGKPWELNETEYQNFKKEGIITESKLDLDPIIGKYQEADPLGTSAKIRCGTFRQIENSPDFSYIDKEIKQMRIGFSARVTNIANFNYETNDLYIKDNATIRQSVTYEKTDPNYSMSYGNIALYREQHTINGLLPPFINLYGEQKDNYSYKNFIVSKYNDNIYWYSLLGYCSNSTIPTNWYTSTWDGIPRNIRFLIFIDKQ